MIQFVEVLMKPVFIPPYIGKEVRSGGEKRMFNVLKNFRMENSYILHSLGLPRHANKVYGEVDFVVVCARGVACLEIKGGSVRRHDGKWIYTAKSGIVTKKAESPFAQAVGNMFALKAELCKKFGNDPKLKDIPVVCGVVFPDIKFEDQSQEVIPEIVFDNGSRSITAYINRIFDYWMNKRGMPEVVLSADEIKAVKDYMRGDFQFIPVLSERLNNIEDGLVRLTREQWMIMSALSENDRLMIEGDAGTGKSLLAFDFANKKALMGNKVLYLTFNKNLASSLQKRVAGQTNLEIINIHALFGEYVEVDSEMISNEPNRYFSEILPREFRRHLDSLSPRELESMQYDIVVMDEGQDIVCQEYLNALEPLLAGGFENGQWALFYDENQNIYNPEYKGGIERLSSCSSTKFKLFMNCRNTVQIGTYCEKASGIKLREYIKENGEEVREVPYSGEDGFRNKLTGILDRLKRGGVKNSDIVILSPKRYQNSILSKAGIAVSEDGSEDHDLPMFSTIQSFKGLDSKVVILCGLEDIPEENYSKFIYIAATRARVLLYVLKNSQA